ncbi:MAG: hypothetical protein ACRDZP_06105 [Acidimicrobiales bacterium]
MAFLAAGFSLVTLAGISLPAGASALSGAGTRSATVLTTISRAQPVISKAGIRPPKNPSKSLPPSPDFLSNSACRGSKDTASCNTVVLKAVTHARSVLEKMGAMKFALSGYDKLTGAEQLFVTANLERAARGIPVVSELTKSLDALALVGARTESDPPFYTSGYLPGGGRSEGQGGNWAAGYDNPLGSDYGWMYDDGYPSPNLDCRRAGAPGCWGHRDNVLRTYASATICGVLGVETVMGAAKVAVAKLGDSETELFVGVCGKMPTDAVFTWTRAKQLLHIS